MRHLNRCVHTELTKLQELIEGKGMKKSIEEKPDTKLEEFDESLGEIEAKSGGSGAQEDDKGELAEMKQQIVVLEHRIEESETMIMTQVHREQTNSLVSKEELVISLVPQVDELKGNVEVLKGDWEILPGLSRDLRCINYEVKKLTK